MGLFGFSTAVASWYLAAALLCAAGKVTPMTDLGAVSSWVAAGVAAVSAAVTVWKAWMWRPVPRFVTEPAKLAYSLPGAMSLHPYGSLMGPRDQFACGLVNVGDGPALDVTLTGDSCLALFVEKRSDDLRGVSTRTRVGHIPPGGEATVVLLPGYLVRDGQVERSGERPEQGTVRAVLSWSAPPARSSRRFLRTLVIDGESARFDDEPPVGSVPQL